MRPPGLGRVSPLTFRSANPLVAGVVVGGLIALAGGNARGQARQSARELAAAHDARGASLGERGDLNGAAAAFRESMRADPTFAVARLHLGLALERQGMLQDAGAAYMQALRLDLGLLEARYGLSSVCAKLGDIDGAILLLRQVVAAMPALGEAHYNLGVNLWTRYKSAPGPRRAGDLDEARSVLKRAIALDADRAEFHAALGQLLADTQDLDGAVASFRRARALEPSRAERAYDLGLALRMQGNLESAEAELRSAIAADPSHGPAHRALGLVLRTSGDLTGAEREFRAAIAASPGDPQAHHLLGSLLLKGGTPEAGMAMLERALDLDPSLVEARVAVAQSLARGGRTDEARRQQEEIRRINAERAALSRAMVLVDTAADRRAAGDAEGAVTALREAVTVAPAFAEAQYQLAVVLNERSAPAAEVSALLARTVEIDPRHARAWYQRGSLEARHGGKAVAREAFDRAAAIAPGLVAAQRARAALAESAADWPTVVAALDAVIAWESGDAADHLAIARALRQLQKTDEAAVSDRVAAAMKGTGR